MTTANNIKNIHGCALNIAGLGVLLIGASALGKSQLTLELIDRGHSFIADDMVAIYLDRHGVIALTSVRADFLHSRELGFVNIRRLYPDKVLNSASLDIVIELVANNSSAESSDKVANYYSILDNKIPKYVLTAYSKNALMIELIVRQHTLLLTGYDSNSDFMAKQQLLCN